MVKSKLPSQSGIKRVHKVKKSYCTWVFSFKGYNNNTDIKQKKGF